MTCRKETIVIGSILLNIIFFATGVSLGEVTLGKAECKETIEFLSMLGGWISAICTLAAVLAALHISNKQNEISSSNKKEEIYNAFFELKMHMTQKGQFADRSEVSKFYQFARKSSLIFRKELASDINKYYEVCLEVATINEQNKVAEKPEPTNSSTLTKEARELAQKIDSKIFKIIAQTIT